MFRIVLLLLFVCSVKFIAAQIVPQINSGHSFNIHALAISQDGKLMASAAGDKSVVIWDVNTGKLIKRFTGISGTNLSIAFNSKNELIINNAQYINTINDRLTLGKEFNKFGSELSMGTYVTLPADNSGNIIINDGYSLLKEFDANGKELMVYEGEPGYLQDAALSSDQKTLYGLTRYGGFYVWDRSTGKLIDSHKRIMEETYDLSLSANEEKVLICGESGDILIYSSESKSFDTISLKGAYSVVGVNYVNDDIVAASGSYIYRIDPNDKSIVAKQEITLPINKLKFSEDGHHLLFGTAEYGVGIIECADEFIIRDFMTPGTAVKTIFSYDNFIGFQGTDEKVRLIDLRNIVEPIFVGKTLDKYYMQSHLLGSLNTSEMGNANLLLQAKEEQLVVTDISTGKINFAKEYEDNIIHCGFTKDDQHIYVLSSGYSVSLIEIIDLEKGEIVYSYSDSINTIKALDGNLGSTTMCYTLEKYENYTNQVELMLFDWKEKMVVATKSCGDLSVTGLQMAKNGNIILSTGGFKQVIKLFNNKLDLLKEYKGRIAVFSDHEDKMAVYENVIGEEFATIKIVDLTNNKEKTIENAHLSIISHLTFAGNDRFLVSASWDKTVKIWDLESYELLSTFIFHNGNDDNFIVFNPEGYFFSTREAAKDVHFVKDNTIYLFEQFDAILNRPDKILESFPGSSSQKIDLYRKLFEKRKSRENSTGQLNNNAPQLIVSTPNLDFISKGPNFNFRLEYSSGIPVTKAIVIVNGVPVKREEIEPTNDGYLETSVPLQSGENRIAIYIEDQNGVQSLRYYIKKHFNSSKLTKTYVVTVGVSSFQQSEFNLTYAAKDAKDIGSYFSKSENVHHISITDEAFTSNNWQKLLVPLKEATIDDRILVFISTHGVLDQNLDYYLASNDIDFNNPSEKGISVEELERVFSSFLPVKKVIFLDACHSGELDKNDIVQQAESMTFEDDVTFRSVGTSMVNFTRLDSENSLDACKTIFTDLSSSSGISIISSASAVEFAREGDQWKNGVFTYCLLSGLDSQLADGNGDGEVHIVELTNYLYENVNSLTNGKQKPSSRVQNVLNDFVIMKY